MGRTGLKQVPDCCPPRQLAALRLHRQYKTCPPSLRTASYAASSNPPALGHALCRSLGPSDSMIAAAAVVGPNVGAGLQAAGAGTRLLIAIGGCRLQLCSEWLCPTDRRHCGRRVARCRHRLPLSHTGSGNRLPSCLPAEPAAVPGHACGGRGHRPPLHHGALLPQCSGGEGSLCAWRLADAVASRCRLPAAIAWLAGLLDCKPAGGRAPTGTHPPRPALASCHCHWRWRLCPAVAAVLRGPAGDAPDAYLLLLLSSQHW